MGWPAPHATRRCWARRRARPRRAGHEATRPRPGIRGRCTLSIHSPSSTLGQSPRGEGGRVLGVAAELGQIASVERDQRRDIHQHGWRPGRRSARTAPPPQPRTRARPRPRSGSTASIRPLMVAISACASSSRGRDRTRSAGSADSHRCIVAASPRGCRTRRSAARSAGRPRSSPRRRPRAGSRHRPARAPRTRRPRYGAVRDPAGLFLLQAGAQQVGEQVVVAPPAAHLIKRHQEQPRPFDLLQQRLAAGAGR